MTHRIDTDTAHRIWNDWLTTVGFKSELLNPCDLIRMVEDELEKRNNGPLVAEHYNKPWHPETEKRNYPCRVFVKDLYVANGTDYDKVWIGDWDSGEGGDFSKDKFYEVVDKFYKDNF